MKRLALLIPIVAFITSRALGRIGDTPERLQERYGAPIKESVDQDGYGLRIYRCDKFKEIRVTFVKGKSQLEQHKIAGEGPVPDSLAEELKQQNAAEHVLVLSNYVEVGTHEPEEELKFVTHSQQERSYSGTLEARDDAYARSRTFVLRDGKVVIEIPAVGSDPQLNDLTVGSKYTMTVLDEHFEDLETQIAIVARREHVDWEDAVHEAHSSFQQLVKISTDEKVVFDRSTCGVHHVKMELRGVDLVYGMYAAQSDAESYCMSHFPHFRAFALGGCVEIEGGPKSAFLYVCPKCVAECNEYTRQHPPKNEPK
jgi:hypothetical protein